MEDGTIILGLGGLILALVASIGCYEVAETKLNNDAIVDLVRAGATAIEAKCAIRPNANENCTALLRGGK